MPSTRTLIRAAIAAAALATAAPAHALDVHIVNRTHDTFITARTIHRAGVALADQINGQVSRFWPVPHVHFAPHGWPLILSDAKPPKRGMGGQHWPANCPPTLGCRPGSTPYAIVYVRHISGGDGGWTVGASHELIEMLTDPGLAATANGWYREIADPAEGCYYGAGPFYPYTGNDGRTYHDRMQVADFVTPAWYGLASSRRYDFTRDIHSGADAGGSCLDGSAENTNGSGLSF